MNVLQTHACLTITVSVYSLFFFLFRKLQIFLLWSHSQQLCFISLMHGELTSGPVIISKALNWLEFRVLAGTRTLFQIFYIYFKIFILSSQRWDVVELVRQDFITVDVGMCSGNVYQRTLRLPRYILLMINSIVRNLYWDSQMAKKLSNLKPRRLTNL